MGNAINDVPPVGLYFTVTIDGHTSLGSWQTCDGLGAEVTVKQREEGGNSSFVHQLPGGIKYSNVKLTRTINGESGKLAAWLSSMAGGVKRVTAEISVMTPDLKKVASWNLMGAFPAKWSGPSLGSDAGKGATETLEIAHHGFLPGAG